MRFNDYWPGDVITSSAPWALKVGPSYRDFVTVAAGSPMFVVTTGRIQWHDASDAMVNALYVISEHVIGWLIVVDREDIEYLTLHARYDGRKV